MKLTSAARKKLPKSDFVFPEEEEYPIEDKSHARNALSRVAANGTPAQKAKVKRAVKAKYPGIKQKGEAKPKAKAKGKVAAKPRSSKHSEPKSKKSALRRGSKGRRGGGTISFLV